MGEAKTIRHEQISSAEAFQTVVNGALARLPAGAEIVSVQVILAYRTAEMEPQAVEACGSAITKAGYPMDEMARLFALYTTAEWKGWAPHPQMPKKPDGALRVRRRPRR